MKKNYIGQKGYSIYKKNLSIEEQNNIRRDLLVQATVPKSPVKPDPFPVYLESPEKIYIPRYYGLLNFGDVELKISKGEEINLKFNGSLRDYQENVVFKYINHVTKNDLIGGGLIDLPCGRGKTVIAINIITKLKRKTLIVVHKGFLLSQWVERIKAFCPEARIGLIQGQVIDIENKDIVIGMLQSLSMKEYPQDQFKNFGLTIFDECHHISSETFSRAMQKIITHYTLGLSATMNRKDGLINTVINNFQLIFVKRSLTPQEGNTVDAILSRAEYALNNKNYDKLFKELNKLPKEASVVMDEWRKIFERNLENNS